MSTAGGWRSLILAISKLSGNLCLRSARFTVALEGWTNNTILVRSQHSVVQHLDALEQEAEEKGGVQQVLADHFAKVYKVTLPLAA